MATREGEEPQVQRTSRQTEVHLGLFTTERVLDILLDPETSQLRTRTQIRDRAKDLRAESVQSFAGLGDPGFHSPIDGLLLDTVLQLLRKVQA